MIEKPVARVKLNLPENEGPAKECDGLVRVGSCVSGFDLILNRRGDKPRKYSTVEATATDPLMVGVVTFPATDPNRDKLHLLYKSPTDGMNASEAASTSLPLRLRVYPPSPSEKRKPQRMEAADEQPEEQTNSRTSTDCPSTMGSSDSGFDGSATLGSPLSAGKRQRLSKSVSPRVSILGECKVLSQHPGPPLTKSVECVAGKLLLAGGVNSFRMFRLGPNPLSSAPEGPECKLVLDLPQTPSVATQLALPHPLRVHSLNKYSCLKVKDGLALWVVRDESADETMDYSRTLILVRLASRKVILRFNLIPMLEKSTSDDRPLNPQTLLSVDLLLDTLDWQFHLNNSAYSQQKKYVVKAVRLNPGEVPIWLHPNPNGSPSASTCAIAELDLTSRKVLPIAEVSIPQHRLRLSKFSFPLACLSADSSTLLILNSGVNISAGGAGGSQDGPVKFKDEPHSNSTIVQIWHKRLPSAGYELLGEHLLTCFRPQNTSESMLHLCLVDVQPRWPNNSMFADDLCTTAFPSDVYLAVGDRGTMVFFTVDLCFGPPPLSACILRNAPLKALDECCQSSQIAGQESSISAAVRVLLRMESESPHLFYDLPEVACRGRWVQKDQTLNCSVKVQFGSECFFMVSANLRI